MIAGTVVASIPSPSKGTLDIGPLSIHAYGLMIALGVVAAVWLLGRRLEQSQHRGGGRIVPRNGEITFTNNFHTGGRAQKIRDGEGPGIPVANHGAGEAALQRLHLYQQLCRPAPARVCERHIPSVFGGIIIMGRGGAGIRRIVRHFHHHGGTPEMRVPASMLLPGPLGHGILRQHLREGFMVAEELIHHGNHGGSGALGNAERLDPDGLLLFRRSTAIILALNIIEQLRRATPPFIDALLLVPDGEE